MGKGHYFTVPYFTKVYGDTNDKLLFVNSADLSPHSTREEREKSIVPNTEIPTLLKNERCCSLIVKCLNCKDIQLEWHFHPPFVVNDDHSISYDEMDLIITPKSEDPKDV